MKNGHAEISNSKSRKNPFKVRYIGANGEPVAPSETLATRNNCKKNILAVIRMAYGTRMEVHDKTNGRSYILWASGKVNDLVKGLTL